MCERGRKKRRPGGGGSKGTDGWCQAQNSCPEWQGRRRQKVLFMCVCIRSRLPELVFHSCHTYLNNFLCVGSTISTQLAWFLAGKEKQVRNLAIHNLSIVFPNRHFDTWCCALWPFTWKHVSESIVRSLQVGILDIDICGPSVPRMMGVEDEEVRKSNYGWSPVYADDNLGVMSVCLARNSVPFFFFLFLFPPVATFKQSVFECRSCVTHS